MARGEQPSLTHACVFPLPRVRFFLLPPLAGEGRDKGQASATEYPLTPTIRYPYTNSERQTMRIHRQTLGLVLSQYSSGGKKRLGRIKKSGGSYLHSDVLVKPRFPELREALRIRLINSIVEVCNPLTRVIPFNFYDFVHIDIATLRIP